MSIRFATPADTEAVKCIWNKCFGDGDPFLSWNFSRNYDPKDTLVWEENGKVVATLQMQSKAISLYGTVIPGNYIFGIATLPEFRCRGIAKALLEYSFEVAVEREHIVSLLIPFNYRFYEKFGYKMSHKLVKASIKKKFAPNMRSRHIIKSDYTIADLQNVHRKFCEQLNGWIVRSNNEFRLILEDVISNWNGHCLVCRNNSGENIGYTIGILKDDKFSAHEMAYVNDYARDSLIFEIFEKFDCNEIEVTSPLAKCDGLISAEGYTECSKIYPFAMTKVLNEAKFYKICEKNNFFCDYTNYANMLFS